MVTMAMALVLSRWMRTPRTLYSSCFVACSLLSILILSGVPHSKALDEGDSCEVKKNLPGICRTTSQCEPVIDKYIRSGKLTNSEVASCGLGTHEEIVCCPIAECCEDDKPQVTTPRIIQVTPTTRVDVSDKERPVVRACREFQRQQREESLTVHILDGIPVDPGFYPHMAAIAFDSAGNVQYRCGGSLISKRHILTAAHCVNNEQPVFVRMGSVNIAQTSAHYQDIPITNISIHPEYVSSSKYNDIAIMELEHEAKLNFYVYPACLETDARDPPLNSQLFVAGWGVMNQTTRKESKILLRAPLNIVPLDQCNNSLAEQPNSKRFLKNGILVSMLCAADRTRSKADACQGDSGGPLILEQDIVNNKFNIIGVISSGFGCATKTPGLYTRVASYLDFIEKIVWPDNVV